MCMSGTDSDLLTVLLQCIRFKSGGMMCDAEEAQIFVPELLRRSFLPCQQSKN